MQSKETHCTEYKKDGHRNYMDAASEYAIYLSVSKFLQVFRRSFYTLNEEPQKSCTAGNRYNCHMNLRIAAQNYCSGISKS